MKNPCVTVQLQKVDAEPDSCRLLPWEVPDKQCADKPSEFIATGLHIDSLISRNSHKSLSLKTTPVCSENSKSGLAVKLGNAHKGRTRNTSYMHEETV